jgi:hypothetical protein
MGATMSLFGAADAMDSEMPALARRYATRMRWQFTGLEQRLDLFRRPSWRAMFVDRAGGEHERTVDDLRASLDG